MVVDKSLTFFLPVSFAGPARFTPAAAAVGALPPVDAVVISHSHYDHLCVESVRALLALPTPPRAWVAPLGEGALLRKWGAPARAVFELDWWQRADLDHGLRITAVPAQHGSARSAWDKDATLWCGFDVAFGGGARRVFFAGDTGYRAVPQDTPPGSAAEAAAPTCPAFREVRARLGAPDLALLPIGAYSPRGFMSAVHASPEDAVEMLLDLGATRAIGMHYGALPLTDERVEDAPARLRAALRARGLDDARFVTLPAVGAVWREPAREGRAGAAAT